MYIIYIRLGETFGHENIELYRDDGLAALKNVNGRQADKSKKTLIEIFNSFGLKITVQTNQKVVNFLDITFNLHNGTFQPYRKPNDEPLYIHSQSNHPPSILRQLPSSINKRISKLSCDEPTFQAAAPAYQDALKLLKQNSENHLCDECTLNKDCHHSFIQTQQL